MPSSQLPPDFPDISEPLARLISTARWVENGKLGHLDNNVQLAKAVGAALGRPVSPSYIQGLRQKPGTDPRWSMLVAICRVFSQRTGVAVTPEYFLDDSDRAAEVDQLLLLARMRATQELASTPTPHR